MNKGQLIQDLRKGSIDLSKIHAMDKSLTNDPDIVDAALYHRFDKLVKVANFEYDLLTNEKLEIELRRLKNAKYIGNVLLKNKKYMIRLMRKCSGYIFNYFPAKIRNNKELFEVAIKNTGTPYFIKNKMNPCSHKYSFLLQHINFQMGIIRYAGNQIIKDQRLISLAMKYEPFGFFSLPPELRNDLKIRCSMLASYPATALIIEDGSIDTIQEFKCLIKGFTNRYYCLSSDEPYELMQEVWNNKVADNKKTDPMFLAAMEPFLL